MRRIRKRWWCVPDSSYVDVSELDRIIQTMPQRIENWGARTSEGMVNDIKLSFNTSPAGREYGRTKKVKGRNSKGQFTSERASVIHVASQPGYPPNIDMGALRASIRWEMIRKYVFHIMDGVIYGYWLEDGTSTIQPRPFIQPVFDAWRRKIEADVEAFKDLK